MEQWLLKIKEINYILKYIKIENIFNDNNKKSVHPTIISGKYVFTYLFSKMSHVQELCI